MGGDRGTGAQGGAGGGAEDALLLRGDPRLVGADLADDPWANRAVNKLLHDLVGQIVDGAAIDACFGGVVGLAVPAGSGNDVEPGCLREAGQSCKVSADADGGHVHQGAAAKGLIGGQLLVYAWLVADQLPVVPAVLDPPEAALGVLVGEGESEVARRDGAEDGLDLARGGSTAHGGILRPQQPAQPLGSTLVSVGSSPSRRRGGPLGLPRRNM